MIRATFPAPGLACAADPAGRTIAGIAVPWNEPGRVSDGTEVVFHPGALDAAARPVLLRDHDPARPLGRVVDAADTGTGMTVTARIARTRDGDEALVLAAPPDSVLGAFSVGVDPTAWTFDTAGTMHVTAGTWVELSLLTLGAFEAARVATVTAQQGEPPMIDATTDPDAPVDDDDELDDDELDLEQTDDQQDPPAVTASASRRPATVALRAGGGRPLNLAGVSASIHAALRRRVPASHITARIQAALDNVTTTNVAGIVPPAFRAELIPLVDHGMPTVRALASRPLPAVGMTIEYPEWTAPPDAWAIQAAEKTEIASDPVTVTLKSVPIETWAQGNDLSFQAIDRSSPSLIESYLRAAATKAGRSYGVHVCNALLATAAAATAGTTFIGNVRALFDALDPNTTPAGGLFLALSYDQGASMIDVPADAGPAFWSATLGIGDMTPNPGGGLNMFVDTNLPAGTMLLGSSAGAVTYGGPDSMVDVRVVDVSLLGVDIGVYFYAALALEYPQAFAKLTGLTAAGAATTTSKTSK